VVGLLSKPLADELDHIQSLFSPVASYKQLRALEVYQSPPISPFFGSLFKGFIFY